MTGTTQSSTPAQTWKTSCFVWIRGLTATNDLTDEKHVLTAIERQILSELQTEPTDLKGLARRLARPANDTTPLLDSLVERGLVVPFEEDESSKYSVNRVDIEIGSHCNARCQYCPVSLDPKPKHVMSMELFELAVRQVAPHHPEWVALNNFSEPLLDPFFVERCRYLEEHGLKVALFTNASILRPAIREYLAGSEVLHSIIINFASENAEEWGAMMGLPPALHPRTVENINALAEIYQGPISISVHGLNGTHRRRTQNIAALFQRFPNVNVLEFPTNTLAGTIEGELVGLPTLVQTPKMAGCNRVAGHVHISWSGDVYICCLDYAQEVKFGNIAGSSIEEILGGPIARDYRRQIYGLQQADPDLLCRKCCHIRLESIA